MRTTCKTCRQLAFHSFLCLFWSLVVVVVVVVYRYSSIVGKYMSGILGDSIGMRKILQDKLSFLSVSCTLAVVVVGSISTMKGTVGRIG